MWLTLSKRHIEKNGQISSFRSVSLKECIPAVRFNGIFRISIHKISINTLFE